jgi:hypothetical protein
MPDAILRGGGSPFRAPPAALFNRSFQPSHNAIPRRQFCGPPAPSTRLSPPLLIPNKIAEAGKISAFALISVLLVVSPHAF